MKQFKMELSRLFNQFKRNVHLREIAGGAMLAFGIKIFAIGFSFLQNIVIARSLGVAETGKFFLLFSLINLVVVFGKQGIDRSILRLLSPKASEKDWEAVKIIFEYGVKSILKYAIILTISIYIFSDTIALFLFQRPDLGDALKYFSLSIIPLSLSFCIAEAYKALKNITLALSIRGIFIPFAIILGIYFFASDYGLLGVVFSFFVASMTIVVLMIVNFYIILNENLVLENKTYELDTDEFNLSKHALFIETLLTEVYMAFPVFIIGFFMVDEAIGKYEITRRIALSTNLFIFAFSAVLSPKIGELFQKKQIELLDEVVRKSVVLIVLFTLPVFAVLFLFPEFLLSLFGKEFVEGSVSLLRIILIGHFFHVLFGPTGNIMLMCGYENYLRNSAILSMVLIVIFSLILIPIFGLTGAGIAYSSTIILSNFYIAYGVKKELNIITIPYAKKFIFER